MKDTTALILVFLASCTEAFSPRLFGYRTQTRLAIYAPPGSGYARLEDEESLLPDTYEPMMEYPGTMRPGRTPENMPFQDLPLDGPDPVPWPHFQQIEWHHRWDAPHEHPIPMEQFIDQQGRWATPEMEAAMRAGVRRDVRERRAQEEEATSGMVITDDDDDDDDIPDEPIALGDGIFGKLGSDDDRAATAAAVAPGASREEDDEEEDDLDTGDLDDFLLDLGLDSELDEDMPPSAAAGDDDEFEDEDAKTITVGKGGTTAMISVDDDDSDIDFGLDEDDEDDGVDTVPLEDFGDSDTLDTEDIFDEGGFDFDDGDFGDFDGGDDW